MMKNGCLQNEIRGQNKKKSKAKLYPSFKKKKKSLKDALFVYNCQDPRNFMRYKQEKLH